jgi:hypothetical protein
VKSSFLKTVFILLLVSAAPASSNQLTSQAPPITLQEPSQLGTFLRVDPTTGALSDVEAVKKLGIKKGKSIGVGGYFYTTFIDGGAASPIRFSSGETLTFVVRLTGGAPDNLKSDLRLMQLTVQDGKRYLTKTYIPLDVQSYGQLVYGLNPHRRKLGALSFRLTPLARLAPGEYALGLVFRGGGFFDAYAFGIDGSAPSSTAR